MRQVLLEIPIPFTNHQLPIFGFGVSLFIAFLAANWIGTRVARRDGMDADRLVDMGLWIFIWGIVGSRLLFMIRNPEEFHGPLAFFKIWQGGIVFYGGVVSGTLVYLYYTARHKLPRMRVLDVFAPAVAIGIAFGRIGCLLNGCCWGAVTDSPLAIRFPYGSIPHVDHLLRHPDKASLGIRFSMRDASEPIVESVDRDSWADRAGLARGDSIRRVNDREVARPEGAGVLRDGSALFALFRQLEPGSAVSLEVDRGGQIKKISGRFEPRPPHSLPVHPTQLYLALAGAALTGLTLWYFPRRRRPGEVMAVFMIGYAVTRFGIEFLRADEPAWADGLTISQNFSVLLAVGGVILFVFLRRQGPLQVSPQSQGSAANHHAAANAITPSTKPALPPS